MEIAVLGVGCIGSVVAAHFARAGHNVRLVARGKRGQALAQHGLVVRKHGVRRSEHFALPVVDALDAAPAELVIVTVQTQQVTDLMPALVRHPARQICFLLNAHPVPEAWTSALGARLVLGFPAMLAGYRGHEVAYRTLPAALRVAIITTLGTAAGGDERAARALVKAFVDVGLSAAFHGDMPSWLASHAALITGLMAFASGRLAAGKSLAMSPGDALEVAHALREGLALVQGAGLSLAPLNVAALSATPASAIASGLWVASQTPWFRQAVSDYVEHGQQEVAAMYAGLRAAGGAVPAPHLDRLCTPAGEGTRA